MSSVFALVPYTAAFTPALLKYSVKIPKSMITNPTWVKIRNFSAAYRRFDPPPIPPKKNNGRGTRPPKIANKKKTNAMKTPAKALPRYSENPHKPPGRPRGHAHPGWGRGLAG